MNPAPSRATLTLSPFSVFLFFRQLLPGAGLVVIVDVESHACKDRGKERLLGCYVFTDEVEIFFGRERERS